MSVEGNKAAPWPKEEHIKGEEWLEFVNETIRYMDRFLYDANNSDERLRSLARLAGSTLAFDGVEASFKSTGKHKKALIVPYEILPKKPPKH